MPLVTLQLHIDLSAPVDVYSDWVDACDAVAKSTANQYEGDEPRAGPSRASPIPLDSADTDGRAHGPDNEDDY